MGCRHISRCLVLPHIEFWPFSGPLVFSMFSPHNEFGPFWGPPFFKMSVFHPTQIFRQFGADPTFSAVLALLRARRVFFPHLGPSPQVGCCPADSPNVQLGGFGFESCTASFAVSSPASLLQRNGNRDILRSTHAS